MQDDERIARARDRFARDLERIERLRSIDDLPAPWESRPDIPKGSIGWRMGTGETIMAEWGNWFGALSPERREAYCKAHPEPETWSDWYKFKLEQIERCPPEERGEHVWT